KVAVRDALGDGLSGLALDGDEVLTLAQFDRALIAWTRPNAHRAVGLSQAPQQGELALGRKLFHQATDPRLSGAQLSCAMCHPDGREDGLVWRLQGTRLQTPMLAAKLAETAPYNWHGTAQTLEENIGQTVKRLGGRGLQPDEERALARYLREGLHAPRAPQARDAALVELGRDVFSRASVGCSECHTLDGTFTDGARHDVGTLSAAERAELAQAHDKTTDPARFDTPSLIGVGLTA